MDASPKSVSHIWLVLLFKNSQTRTINVVLHEQIKSILKFSCTGVIGRFLFHEKN